MRAPSSSLLLMMSFAAGTFSAGASDNPQHLMLASPSGGVPNNPLPLIIWPRVVPEDEEIALWFEKTFEENGWPPAWRYPIYPYTHYHPNTHELLGVAEGWAEVLFGGDSGRMVTLRAGDAVLIPAGVGHRQVSASDDFMEQVKNVPLPTQDPFTGKEGALTEIWQPIAAMHLQQQTDF